LAVNDFLANSNQGNCGTQQEFSVSIKFQKNMYHFNKHELGFVT